MLFLLSVAHAQDTVSRDAAIAHALENAESVQLIHERAAGLRAVGKQTTAFLKPQADLSARHLWRDTNAPEIPIPELMFPDKDIAGQIELTQLLFAGGRIWRSLELEKNFFKRAEQENTLGIRDIVEQVKVAFDTVLYRKATVRVLEDRLSQRKTELEDAQDLWNVGMVTLLDVRQARLHLNFARDSLEAGKALLDESLIDFNVAIGRFGNERLLLPDGALKDFPDIAPVIRLLFEKLESEQIVDLQLSKSQAEAALLNYRIARGEYFPQIRFTSSAATQGEATDDMDEYWSAGLELQWNIFDGGLIRARVDEAGTELRGAQKNLERTRKALSGQVEKISVNEQSLRNRSALQQEAVELSKENYEDARGQYRAGTITLTRLGEFNLSYNEARFGLLEIYFLQRRLLAEAEGLLESVSD